MIFRQKCKGYHYNYILSELELISEKVCIIVKFGHIFSNNLFSSTNMIKLNARHKRETCKSVNFLPKNAAASLKELD